MGSSSRFMIDAQPPPCCSFCSSFSRENDSSIESIAHSLINKHNQELYIDDVAPFGIIKKHVKRWWSQHSGDFVAHVCNGNAQNLRFLLG